MSPVLGAEVFIPINAITRTLKADTRFSSDPPVFGEGIYST